MFGMVKGRFRVLLKTMELQDISTIVDVIVSCFLLHNFCLREGQPCPSHWIVAANEEQSCTNQVGAAGSGDTIEENSAVVRERGQAVRNNLLQIHVRQQ
jgi:hypothetical protein